MKEETDNQIIDDLLNKGTVEVKAKKVPETFADVDLLMNLYRSGRTVNDLAGIFYITVPKAKEIVEYYEKL